MPALPCANHPNETTFVRCGRCDKPICVRCMVDTPVGKKCRECSQNRTHLSESSPGQVGLAFAAALAAAVPAGWIMQTYPLLFILAFVYGYVVAEAGLWAGKRSRSTAMQVAVGAAALIGGLLGAGIPEAMPPGMPEHVTAGFNWKAVLHPVSLLVTGLGTAAAVSRVRFL